VLLRASLRFAFEAGVGQKLLGLDAPMVVRKFCEKFLDPYSPALILAGESRLRQK
jgi:hypothetical protein